MVRQPACDRAQTWISLRLDGEISAFENSLLESHLERCEECAAAAARVEAATWLLREAPAEAMPVPLTVPRVRARGSRRAFAVAATAVLAAVVLVTGVGSVGALRAIDGAGSTPKLQRVSAVSGMVDDLQLLAGVRVLRNERPIPGRIVWPA